MPTLDKRPPCKEIGCRERASHRGYCEAHQKNVGEIHKLYDNTQRNPDKAKVYRSRRWRNKRLKILRDTPLCTMCHSNGKVVLAQMVDHLVGFTDEDDPHAWDDDYLYPLCYRCHAIVTHLEKKIDFSQMPLKEAVFAKYRAEIKKDQTVYL